MNDIVDGNSLSKIKIINDYFADPALIPQESILQRHKGVLYTLFVITGLRFSLLTTY